MPAMRITPRPVALRSARQPAGEAGVIIPSGNRNQPALRMLQSRHMTYARGDPRIKETRRRFHLRRREEIIRAQRRKQDTLRAWVQQQKDKPCAVNRPGLIGGSNS